MGSFELSEEWQEGLNGISAWCIQSASPVLRLIRNTYYAYIHRGINSIQARLQVGFEPYVLYVALAVLAFSLICWTMRRVFRARRAKQGPEVIADDTAAFTQAQSEAEEARAFAERELDKTRALKEKVQAEQALLSQILQELEQQQQQRLEIKGNLQKLNQLKQWLKQHDHVALLADISRLELEAEHVQGLQARHDELVNWFKENPQQAVLDRRVMELADLKERLIDSQHVATELEGLTVRLAQQLEGCLSVQELWHKDEQNLTKLRCSLDQRQQLLQQWEDDLKVGTEVSRRLDEAWSSGQISDAETLLQKLKLSLSSGALFDAASLRTLAKVREEAAAMIRSNADRAIDVVKQEREQQLRRLQDVSEELQGLEQLREVVEQVAQDASSLQEKRQKLLGVQERIRATELEIVSMQQDAESKTHNHEAQVKMLIEQQVLLQDKTGELEQAVAAFKLEEQQYHEETSSLEDRKLGLEMQRRELDKDRLQLDEQLERFRLDKAAYARQQQELAEETARLQAKIATYNADRSELMKKTQEQQGKSAELKKLELQVKQEQENTARELSNLMAQAADKEGQLQQKMQELEVKDQELDELKAHGEAEEARLASERQVWEMQRRKVEEESAALALQWAKLQEEKESMAHRQQELARANNDLATVKKDVQAMQMVAEWLPAMQQKRDEAQKSFPAGEKPKLLEDIIYTLFAVVEVMDAKGYMHQALSVDDRCEVKKMVADAIAKVRMLLTGDSLAASPAVTAQVLHGKQLSPRAAAGLLAAVSGTPPHKQFADVLYSPSSPVQKKASPRLTVPQNLSITQQMRQELMGKVADARNVTGTRTVTKSPRAAVHTGPRSAPPAPGQIAPAMRGSAAAQERHQEAVRSFSAAKGLFNENAASHNIIRASVEAKLGHFAGPGDDTAGGARDQSPQGGDKEQPVLGDEAMISVDTHLISDQVNRAEQYYAHNASQFSQLHPLLNPPLNNPLFNDQDTGADSDKASGLKTMSDALSPEARALFELTKTGEDECVKLEERFRKYSMDAEEPAEVPCLTPRRQTFPVMALTPSELISTTPYFDANVEMPTPYLTPNQAVPNEVPSPIRIGLGFHE